MKKKSCCRVTAWEMVSALGANLAESSSRLNAAGCLLTPNYVLLPNQQTFVGWVPLPQRAEWDQAPQNRVILHLTDYLLDLLAAPLARAQAKWQAGRFAVILGTSTGNMVATERAFSHYCVTGQAPADYNFYTNDLNSLVALAQNRLQVQGPCYSLSTACSSGAHAFGVAKQLMDAGRIDAALVGGVDGLCKLTVNGFHSLELIDGNWCDPFANNNGGLNIGEVGCLALLEREPGGCQLVGYGASSDGHHMTSPTPEGPIAAMRMALADANLVPAEMDYLNLHGTGTKQNDLAESTAVNQVFGSETPCSSTKHLTGHCLGAAGAIEAGIVLALLSQQGQVELPRQPLRSGVNANNPSIGLVRPGQRLERPGNRVMMSNSFAFGGNNCSLIFANHDHT